MAKSAAAEVEKMKMLEERIKAPSIWGRVPCGIRFEDLQDRRYEDAIRLLKKHYLPEETRERTIDILLDLFKCFLSEASKIKLSAKNIPYNARLTYKSVKISEEKEGVDEFVHNVRIWMKDKMSIAAVKEGTDKLVGVLIMRIQEKSKLDSEGRSVLGKVVGISRRIMKGAFSRTFSRVKITYNPQYTTVMTFYKEIEKTVDLYDKLEVRRYFKVYILALKTRYRHRGIAKEMLKAAIALSASANVPAVAGIFTTGRGQQIAEEIGFEKYNELYYVRYIIDDEIVFWDTGLGNYGAALMAYRIPAVEEPQEMQTQASSRFNIQPLADDDEDK